MKVLVTHSKSGKIVSLAIPNPFSQKTVSPRPRKGQSVAEVELPGLDLGAKDLNRRLSDLVKGHKVTTGGRGPQLVKTKK